MKGRGPLKCPIKLIGTPNQQLWIRRGGASSSGSGPAGWKLKPARQTARSLAEMAAKYRILKKGGRK